jgi:hypothetical protein
MTVLLVRKHIIKAAAGAREGIRRGECHMALTFSSVSLPTHTPPRRLTHV